MMAREKDLGRFAGEKSERCDTSDSVAREECAECASEWQMCAWRHAQPPALGAHGEAQPLERQYRRQTPANPLNAADDFVDARAPHDVGKKTEAARGAYSSDDDSATFPSARLDRSCGTFEAPHCGRLDVAHRRRLDVTHACSGPADPAEERGVTRWAGIRPVSALLE